MYQSLAPPHFGNMQIELQYTIKKCCTEILDWSENARWLSNEGIYFKIKAGPEIET